MANGKIGDHPLTDIVVYKRRVYSEIADGLIRRIVELGGEREIADMLLRDYNVFRNPDVPGLERVLGEIHDRLLRDAHSQGWEVED